jgi:hypothetical protein
VPRHYDARALQFLTHPTFETGHESSALGLACREPGIGIKPVDSPLNLEQGVDALDRLQCDWRDHGCLLSLGLLPGTGLDVSEDEELPPPMAPTSGVGDWPGFPGGIIKLGISLNMFCKHSDGYNALYAVTRMPAPIKEAACWAHWRCKLFDLAKLAKAPIAVEAVRRMDEIFAFERTIAHKPPGERAAA